MEIIGKITKLYPIQSGTSKAGNAWQKRDIIVEEAVDEYPNSIAITAFGDRVEKLATYKEGDNVVVKFDTRAKDYNGKAYNNVNMYDIALKSIQSKTQTQYVGQSVQQVEQPSASVQQPQMFQQIPAQPIQPAQPQFDDDLPF